MKGESLAVSRRSFLGDLFSQAVDGITSSLQQTVVAIQAGAGNAVAGPESHARPLLPPGAAAPEAFRAVCTRCDACISACPHGAIRKAGHELGPHVGYPVMTPAESPCKLCRDVPCVAACAPGALRPLAREEIRLGVARVDENACHLANGQPCEYCVKACPLRPRAIRFDDQMRPEVLDGCTGCGECAWLCPARAIAIR